MCGRRRAREGGVLPASLRRGLHRRVRRSSLGGERLQARCRFGCPGDAAYALAEEHPEIPGLPVQEDIAPLPVVDSHGARRRRL